MGDDVDDDEVDDDDVNDDDGDNDDNDDVDYDDGDHNVKVFATLVVMTKELCVFLLDKNQ